VDICKYSAFEILKPKYKN